MSHSVYISIDDGIISLRDYSNGFDLRAPYESISNVMDALDEVIGRSRNSRADVLFSELGPIKEWNGRRGEDFIGSNWIKRHRAHIIKDKLLQALPEYNTEYDNIKEYLSSVLGYKRLVKKHLKAKLYKSSISWLKVISEKGEKLNEKSSC
jgi:hypothetical protein